MKEHVRTSDIIRIAVLTIAMTSLIDALRQSGVLPATATASFLLALVLFIISIKVW